MKNQPANLATVELPSRASFTVVFSHFSSRRWREKDRVRFAVQVADSRRKLRGIAATDCSLIMPFFTIRRFRCTFYEFARLITSRSARLTVKKREQTGDTHM